VATRSVRWRSGWVAAANIHNAPIIIDYAGPNPPDSAGGVVYGLYFLNTSEKTIKYINAKIRAYNSVGDPQRGEIDRSSTRSIEFTGPTAPKEYAQAAWGPLWYNSTITCATITSLKITYMDGKSISFNAKQVSNFMRPYQKYSHLVQRTENTCNV
jgi:hypothetical protein